VDKGRHVTVSLAGGDVIHCEDGLSPVSMDHKSSFHDLSRSIWGDAVSFERVIFGRVNVRSAPEQIPNGGEYFMKLVDFLTEQRSPWIWDESRPFSGDAWLVSMGAEGTGGYASSDFVLPGTLRRASHPAEVVLFALDRENRYLAFTAEEPMSVPAVAGSMHLAFQAIGRRFLGAPGWVSFDVDLVCSRTKIFEWLQKHPDVWEMTLWIRHTNPGIPFAEVREELIRLKGQQEKRTITAPEGGALELDVETVSTIGAETEQGHADVRLRAGPRTNVVQFHSRDVTDQERLPEAMSELGRAAGHVIDALRRWRVQHP
jgi:hypothetical protein